MALFKIIVTTSGARLRRACAVPSFMIAVSLLSACADLAGLPLGSLNSGPGGVPQAVESDYELGKRELLAGRLGLAVHHFLAALKQAPKSTEALNGLGAAFDRLGRFDLSAHAYSRALAVDPGAVQTLNNMGYSFYLQGRYELAVSYLRDASSRAGADALTQENHRLAVLALARAGGPSIRSPDKGPVFADVHRTPYIRRAGKAIRHLVTKQLQAADFDPVPASPTKDLLPAFVAAPMAIEGTGGKLPARGVAQTRRTNRRSSSLP